MLMSSFVSKKDRLRTLDCFNKLRPKLVFEQYLGCCKAEKQCVGLARFSEGGFYLYEYLGATILNLDM